MKVIKLIMEGGSVVTTNLNKERFKNFLYPFNYHHVYNMMCTLLDVNPTPQNRVVDSNYMPFHKDIMGCVESGYVKIERVCENELFNTDKSIYNSSANSSLQISWRDLELSLNKRSDTLFDEFKKKLECFGLNYKEAYLNGISDTFTKIVNHSDTNLVDDLLIFFKNNTLTSMCNYICSHKDYKGVKRSDFMPWQLEKRNRKGVAYSNIYNAVIYIPLSDELEKEYDLHSKKFTSMLDGGVVSVVGFFDISKVDVYDYTPIKDLITIRTDEIFLKDYLNNGILDDVSVKNVYQDYGIDWDIAYLDSYLDKKGKIEITEKKIIMNLEELIEKKLNKTIDLEQESKKEKTIKTNKTDMTKKTSKQLKSLEFRLNLKGEGLVNYNGNKPNESQKKRFYNILKDDSGKTYDNVLYAKEVISKTTSVNSNGENVDDYIVKKKISNNLVRKAILGDEDDNTPTTQMISDNEDIRIILHTQPLNIARGWMVTLEKSKNSDLDSLKKNPPKEKLDKNGKVKEVKEKVTGDVLKRVSALSVSHAIQTCNQVTTMDVHSKTGERDATSFFYKETCGEIYYQSKVFIDVKKLQFLSLDDNFDRASFYEKDATKVIDTIKNNGGDAKKGRFRTSRRNLVGECGIVLSNDFVKKSIREVVEKMLNFEIRRAGSYAVLDSLTLKLDDKDVTIKTIEDFDNLNLEFGCDFEDMNTI